jgi:20S proteasome subunit beta 4
MAPAVLDRYWKPNMTIDEGLVLMKRIIDQLKQRFAFSQNNFLIKIMTKDGVQVIKY